MSKQRQGIWAALRSERGNGIMGAVILAGVAGAVMYGVGHSLETSQQSVAADKIKGGAERANYSSLAVYEKLFSYEPKKQPSIFPDPYIVLPGQFASLLPITAGSGAGWSLNGGLVSFLTPDPRHFSVDQISDLYAKATLPALDPSRDQTTSVAVVQIEPPSNPSYPYLIEKFVVDAASLARPEKADVQPKTVTTRARIALPPPPPPTCTVAASAKRVKMNAPVTFSVYGNGVVVDGNIVYRKNGAQASLVTGTYPAKAPTPAISVRSSNVLLKQTTFAAVADKSELETVYVDATVLGPSGASATCSTSIQVEVPDCYKTTPCPNQPAWWTLVPNFISHGYKVAGAQICFDSSRKFDDSSAPLGVNGPAMRSDPPNCNNFRYWRNRNEVGCFAPETLITMGDGTQQPAWAIHQGDEVWNPILRKAVVVRDVVAGPELLPMYQIGFAGKVVTVTETHPFPTKQGLKAAKALSPLDFVQDEAGRFQPVTLANKLPLDESQFVFNFVLDGDDDPATHMLLAGGIVTGDLKLQEKMTEKKAVAANAKEATEVP